MFIILIEHWQAGYETALSGLSFRHHPYRTKPRDAQKLKSWQFGWRVGHTRRQA